MLDAKDRRLLDVLQLQQTQNIDMHQRRIVNAASSIDSNDYVTRSELNTAIGGGSGGSGGVGTGVANRLSKYLTPSSLGNSQIQDDGTTVAVGLPFTGAAGKLWIAGDGETDVNIVSYTNGAIGSVLGFLKTRGTSTVPLDVANGDVIGTYAGKARTGGLDLNVANVAITIDGTFTSGQRPPARIGFFCASANSASAFERARVDQSGLTVVRIQDATGSATLNNSNHVRFQSSYWTGSANAYRTIDLKLEQLSSTIVELNLIDDTGSKFAGFTRVNGSSADLYIGIDRVTDFTPTSTNGRCVTGGSGGFITVTALTDSSILALTIVAADAGYITCAHEGAGTNLPLKIRTGGANTLILATSGVATFISHVNINGATYTWPSSSASGVLTNNGSGALSWAAAATGNVTTGGGGTGFFAGFSSSTSIADTQLFQSASSGLLLGNVVTDSGSNQNYFVTIGGGSHTGFICAKQTADSPFGSFTCVPGSGYVAVNSGKSGSGTALDLAMFCNGSEVARFTTSGGSKLRIGGTYYDLSVVAGIVNAT